MIKLAFYLRGGELKINTVYLKNMLTKEYPGKECFTAKITPVRAPKSFSQIKYFHCDGFIGRMKQGLRNNGFDVPMEKKAGDDFVKFHIKTHPDIMFTEIVDNKITGDQFRKIRSFESASKEEMSHIIDWCSRVFAPEWCGVELETVEEYKKRLRIK
jgi:hypothetical protein